MEYIPSLNPFVIKLITSLKFVIFSTFCCKCYVVSRSYVDEIKNKISEFLIYCNHYVCLIIMCRCFDHFIIQLIHTT